MSPALTPEKMPGALSRGAARVMGSRFAKPVARVVLVAAGLVLLAVIGRASAAGAFGGVAAGAPTVIASSEFDRMVPPSSAAPLATAGAAPLAADTAPVVAVAPAQATHAAQGRASADDPVILNTALVDELRRLPGIGQKRADAILALRTRLGRFRAVEDLLKVKGIGRAMLKRLRPLVRLDGPLVPLVPASPTTDSGAPPAKG